MAFTKSLYYPWIDIRDEVWLKTAGLYWDKIQTIVPAPIKNPYQSPTARAMQDASILSPLHVTPELEDIEELAPIVLRYLNSDEGLQLLSGTDSEITRLHPEKLPGSLGRLSRMHPGKLAYKIEYMLRDMGLSVPGDDGFLRVNNRFAEFYMTLLASRLSDSIGAGLVTSSALPHNLSVKVKADASMTNLTNRELDEFRFHRHWHRVPRELGQGLLVQLMLEKITLDPETPIEKIISYREKHASELGRFRSKVGELSSSLPNDAPFAAMQQHASDLYLNEVRPALDDLKKSLTGSRIKWLTDSWLKIAFISAGSSSMLAGMGLATANALLVGVGVSLIGSGILYNVEKAGAIRSNPYSYLMRIENGMP
ncbi:MAG: DUF6236 family protein [Trichlorobacter sp.]|nr:DUF6236 family protein [Trichlorobacter sp.]